MIVGECGGGDGEAMSGFADGWDRELLGDLVGSWVTRGYMTGALMDVEQLVNVVDAITRTDATRVHPLGDRRPPPGAAGLLLRREAQRAVEADVLAVEVGVAGDRLDEEGELLGPAHALGEHDVAHEVLPAICLAAR